MRSPFVVPCVPRAPPTVVQVTAKVQDFVKVLRKLDSSENLSYGPVYFIADVAGVGMVPESVVGA